MRCKKWVFALQKGGFYTPKTPFLFFVSITNTLLMCYEHSARRRGPIHRARILTLLKTCISITKYVFPFHRTHISTLSITCFHIIKYVHSFYYTNISVCHFVGVYVYAGTINRTPTAADRLPKHCERSAITLRTPTKLVANIPSGVGADSSCPYPDIIKYVYSRHQIRVSVSPHTHIHIINYVHSHY